MSTAVLVVPGVANARAGLKLEPVGDWTLSQSTSSCKVSRLFEAHGRQALLQLENDNLGPRFQVTVLTGDFRLDKSGLTTGFLPGKPKRWGLPAHVRLPDGRQGVTFNYAMAFEARDSDYKGMDRDDVVALGTAVRDFGLQRELEVDRLYVGDAFSRNLVFHTGSMRVPMLAIRSCLAGLAQRMGVDWKQVGGSVYWPRPKDTAGWRERVRSNYPVAMKEAGIGASFDIVVTVEPDGKASNCSVVGKIPPEEFRAIACALAMAEPFEPGIGADGQPIRSIYSTSITYVPDLKAKRSSSGIAGVMPSLRPVDPGVPSTGD